MFISFSPTEGSAKSYLDNVDMIDDNEKISENNNGNTGVNYEGNLNNQH